MKWFPNLPRVPIVLVIYTIDHDKDVNGFDGVIMSWDPSVILTVAVGDRVFTKNVDSDVANKPIATYGYKNVYCPCIEFISNGTDGTL